jgi:outer membrane protein
MKVFVTILGVAAVLVSTPRAGIAQQGRAISLEEALRIAETQSEQIRVARAGVLRAQGQQLQARSQYLPQINGSVTYTRTLASQFSALQPTAQPEAPPSVPPVPPTDTTTFFQPCLRYLPSSGASDAERLRGLENFARCSSSAGGGIDFSKAGFGAKNQYQLGVSGSLTLWSGGRVQAQNRGALAGRRSADIEMTAQRAQLALSVTEAYFDAVLADKLVAIADSSLAQTEGTLRLTQVARQVGNQSEFELLRAKVTRDNQLPVIIQRRTDRDIAYLRLKQLLNLPYTESVQLTSDIDESVSAPVRVVADIGGSAPPDTSAEARATVRQLNEALRAQEAELTVVRAERLPTISLSSQYGRVAFGSGGVPAWNNFLNNWTVALGASFPLFTGGRIRGGEMMARAAVDETRAQLDQTRELAALDARQSLAQLQQAEAALAASAGTTEQAARAYAIADVRFREGISTQLELSESRLLLEQSRANRAQAARNLQVARMRLALLKDLPLGSGGGNAFGGAAGAAAGSLGGTGAVGGAQSQAGRQGQGSRTTTPQAATSQIPQ